MSTINRVDQAVLLLQDRLRRLAERTSGATARSGGAAPGGKPDSLAPLRLLAQRKGIPEGELRRALVRSLLADSLGEDLAGSLEFQSIAEQVARMLEDSETGRQLVAQVLAELQ